jgi:hypothetical protein
MQIQLSLAPRKCVIARRRRWHSDEDQYLRIRLALSGLISDVEAVEQFARHRYGGCDERAKWD